jgi:hypothetical protein
MSNDRRWQTRHLHPLDLFIKIGIGEKKEIYQILIIAIENMKNVGSNQSHTVLHPIRRYSS